MDRRLVYPNGQIQDADLLATNQGIMTSVGHLIALVMGQVTAIGGFACTPATPANMTVLVGPGSIYSLQNLESTPYGTLPADTAHQLMKQGTNLDTTTLTLAAPTTSGNSIVYLIQAAYSEADTLPQTQPFRDSVTQVVTQQTVPTTRKASCLINAKAGISAATGSAVAPAPDAGYTGLYTVTVAQGQTTITSGNIVRLASAPFFPKLSGLGALALLNAGAGLYADGLGNLAARSIRETLTANRTYYVSATGSDSNNGLAAGSPFATIQYAVNLIQSRLDLGGFNATIQVIDGTYGQTTAINGPFVGNGNVIIQGNAATPGSCIISATSGNCFYATNGAAVSLQGFTLGAANAWCIYADKNSLVNIIGNMTYGNATGTAKAHIAAADGARITITGNYTVAGSSTYHWSAIRNGSVLPSSIAVMAAGTPAFTAFANAIDGGVLYPTAITFSGAAVTGARYSAVLNGIIDTSTNGNATYLPGSTPGTTASGGQYN